MIGDRSMTTTGVNVGSGYSQLQNPDDALRAYREQQIVGSVMEAYVAGAEKAALAAVREAMPSRATAIAGEAFDVGQRLAFHEKRRDGLMALAGFDGSMIPWGMIAENLRTRVLQEEEVLVRTEDEANNATAYNIDPGEARFRHARQKARVDAFVAAYDEAMSRSAGEGNAKPTTVGEEPF